MWRTRVLGLDPGIARLGYGVVDSEAGRLRPVSFGCLETPARMPEADRLQCLFLGLQKIVAATHPQAAAVEQLFFNRNTTTAFTVGMARGICLLAIAQAGLQAVDYTPMQVKLAVTGYGKADKKQVQDMVQRLLHLAQAPQPDDAADALAIAITHAHVGSFHRRLGAAGARLPLPGGDLR